MANIGPGERFDAVKSKVLHASARLFLEKGYTNSTVKEISAEAGVNIGSLVHVFKNKENIMCELVKIVLQAQMETARRLVDGKTDDKIFCYIAETVLQLYMAESSEHIRELYLVAYSLPDSTDTVYHTITGFLEEVFEEQLPNFKTKDFYELEIAAAGIMRGYMSVPCDMYFTMDRKVKRFIETILLIYRTPDEKIKEAIEFALQFDFEKIAQDSIGSLLEYMESKIDEDIWKEKVKD